MECAFVVMDDSEFGGKCHNTATEFYTDEIMTRAWIKRGGVTCLVARCELHTPGKCFTSSNGYKELSFEEFILMEVLCS
jgi:hypothetical protein